MELLRPFRKLAARLIGEPGKLGMSATIGDHQGHRARGYLTDSTDMTANRRSRFRISQRSRTTMA
jgi:hypothetical protein